MAKKSGKFILDSVRQKSFTGSPNNTSYGNIKPPHKNILRLSFLGTKWNNNIIKKSRALGAYEAEARSGDDIYDALNNLAINDIVGENQYIAYGDKSYASRREFIRAFALDATIENCLETISDETIIYDDNGYFANINLDILKSRLKPVEKSKTILKGLQTSYDKVYQAFKFNVSNYAWQYMKKFLTDGFLCFEIIYDNDEYGNATDVIGFKDLDPVSIKPEIRERVNPDTGKREEYKVWIQFAGDIENERELPDASIIYLSWASANYISSLSYVERLIKSFNILRQIENSRIIWNVQNAQNRIKITVPVGSNNEHKIRTRLAEMRALYKEEVNIDTQSGELVYNGTTNFPFYKNYLIPSSGGEEIKFDTIKGEGFDLNSVEQLTYFWDRFLSETKIPRSRFRYSVAKNSSGANYVGDNTVTREEYAFSRFLDRIRILFRDILIKPTWQQFSITYPEFATTDVLKNYITIEYNEENIFKRKKELEIHESSIKLIDSLSKVQDFDGTPYFSKKFLLEQYLEIPESMQKLNAKYKIREKLEIQRKKLEAENQAPDFNDPNSLDAPDTGFAGGMGDFSGGMDMGSDPFSDMGGGMDDFVGGGMDDFGGGDMGGDLGSVADAFGGEEPMDDF